MQEAAVGKSVLASPFNKVVHLETCDFIESRLQHRCFPVKFAKFLTTSILTEHLQCLLLNGLKSLQVIHFFSTLIFFDKFSGNFFFETRFSFTSSPAS